MNLPRPEAMPTYIALTPEPLLSAHPEYPLFRH